MAPTNPRDSQLGFFPQSLLLWSCVVVALCGVVFTYSVNVPLFSLATLPVLFPLGAQSQNMSSQFIDLVKARRTYYALDNTLPVSQDRVTHVVEELLQAVPSAFNSQTNRVVLLFDYEHRILWDMISSALESDASASEDQRAATSQRLAAFNAAAGTVMFFEDEETITDLQGRIPKYVDVFPVWAAHSDGMLQHAIWTALEAEGLGANLQHYNSIAEDITKTWDLPASWKLRAQLVFGGRVEEPADKVSKPLEEKLRVFGSNLRRCRD